jgi:tetratricopeptide (TPR) repeat protein
VLGLYAWPPRLTGGAGRGRTFWAVARDASGWASDRYALAASAASLALVPVCWALASLFRGAAWFSERVNRAINAAAAAHPAVAWGASALLALAVLYGCRWFLLRMVRNGLARLDQAGRESRELMRSVQLSRRLGTAHMIRASLAVLLGLVAQAARIALRMGVASAKIAGAIFAVFFGIFLIFVPYMALVDAAKARSIPFGGRSLFAILVVIAIGTVLVLAVSRFVAPLVVRIAVWSAPPRTAPAWRRQFQAATPLAQVRLLRSTSARSLGLRPGPYLELVTEVEAVVAPAAEGDYWEVRYELEQSLRQERLWAPPEQSAGGEPVFRPPSRGLVHAETLDAAARREKARGRAPKKALSRHLRRLAIVAAVLAVLHGVNLYNRAHRAVYVVDGYPEPIEIRVDRGRWQRFEPFRPWPFYVSDGSHTAEVRRSGAPDDVPHEIIAFSINPPGDSDVARYLARFTDPARYVLNPGGAAILRFRFTTFAAQRGRWRPGSTGYLSAPSFHTFPEGVDYFFQLLPSRGEEDLVSVMEVVEDPPPEGILKYPGLTDPDRLAAMERYLDRSGPQSRELHDYRVYLDLAGRIGEDDRASRFLEAGLGRRPLDAARHKAFISHGFKRGDVRGAVTYYAGAQHRSPADTALNVMAGQFETTAARALAVADSALLARPNDPDALSLQADARDALGQFVDAKRCFVSALKYQPDDMDLHINVLDLDLALNQEGLLRDLHPDVREIQVCWPTWNFSDVFGLVERFTYESEREIRFRVDAARKAREEAGAARPAQAGRALERDTWPDRAELIVYELARQPGGLREAAARINDNGLAARALALADLLEGKVDAAATRDPPLNPMERPRFWLTLSVAAQTRGLLEPARTYRSRAGESFRAVGAPSMTRAAALLAGDPRLKPEPTAADLLLEPTTKAMLLVALAQSEPNGLSRQAHAKLASRLAFRFLAFGPIYQLADYRPILNAAIAGLNQPSGSPAPSTSSRRPQSEN